MVRIIGAAQKDKDVLLYYSYPKGSANYFKIISSHDGLHFNGYSKYVIVAEAKGKEEKSYDWKNFTVSHQGDTYYATYKANTKKPGNLYGATSKDLLRWTKTGKIETIKENGAIVSNYKYNNRHVMFYGEKNINLAFSSDLKTWKTENEPILKPRKEFFDDDDLEIGNVWLSEGHILLVYYVKKKKDGKVRWYVGTALIDKKDPHNVLARAEEPLWQHPEQYHHEKMQALGSVIYGESLILYWLIGENNVYAVTCPIPGKHHGLSDKIFQPLLKKFEKNPIISPDEKHPWESRATFNSAAVYENGKVHFVYRALGDTDLSVLGYATSSDGLTIDDRSEEPIYFPREPWETPGNHMFKTFADHFASGGGYGGVEDPRITKVDNKFYMTYVAYDGANPPRVALTSIDVADFINKNWDKWEKPRLISSPGMVNKNAVIFPEKINGKYVVFHRVYPNILVDFVDDLDFNGTYLKGQHFIPPRKGHWDSKKVGAGAPPIKTKDGWLFIYQSVGYQDPGKYKIGAMMLDFDNPTKVLYRANKPIISPDQEYENAGFKAGVVYPCGAVVKDDNLFVYYGGADTVVCAASADINTFMKEMKYNQEPKLHTVHGSMFS